MLIAKGYDPERTCGDRQATPLHLAALHGSLSALEALIKAEVDMNVRDAHGNTPLIDATMVNYPKLAMRLLDAGAEVNIHGLGGYTALHWAAQTGDASLAKLLINEDDKDRACLEEFGLKTPLHLAAEHSHSEILELLIAQHANIEKEALGGYTAFLLSCSHGSLRCVMSLLQAGGKMNTYSDFEETAFHIAAAGGHVDILEALFKTQPERSGCLINAADAYGDTALHRAVANGHKAVAKALLENGALVSKANKLRQLPFHYAAIHGHVDLISLLLEAEADPEGLDDQSFAVIHYATQWNNLGFVEKLLEAIPTLQLAAKSDTGEIPLHIASREGFQELAAFFLERKVDPNVANSYGYTALHWAAKAARQRMVRKLLNAGCDGLSRSRFGETPFLFAVQSRKVDVVRAFLERGINGCDIPDSGGTTCFHHVARNGDLGMLTMLTPFLHPTSIRQVDCNGLDAMHYAARGGHAEMIDRLTSLGISAAGLQMATRLPIHLAIDEGLSSSVSRLIALKANVNLRHGLRELSPIHMATIKRMPWIVEMLLKAGANPTERDAFGLNALDYAFRDSEIWEKMGRWKITYQPVDLDSRKPILRKIAHRTIRTVLTMKEDSTPKNESERVSNLQVLAFALQSMGTKSDVEAARMCFIELVSSSRFANYYYWPTCGICAIKTSREALYVCKQCSSAELCSACYPEYLRGGGVPKSAPNSFRRLQVLEDQMKPTREACEGTKFLGGRAFHDICVMIPATADWLEEKGKEYDDWEKSQDDPSRFESRKPGRGFLKLFEKASETMAKLKEREKVKTEEQRTAKVKQEDGNQQREKKKEEQDGEDDNGADDADPFSAISDELVSHYANHRPDREIPDFICSNHEYLEVPHISCISAEERACFDADGKLANAWLSKLLERINTEGHADLLANNHNAENHFEGETKIEKIVLTESAQESEAGITDKLHIQMEGQETSAMSAVPEDPLVTENATGDTEKASPSGLPKPSLNDVSSGPSTLRQTTPTANELAREIAKIDFGAGADPIDSPLRSPETNKKLRDLDLISLQLIKAWIETPAENRAVPGEEYPHWKQYQTSDQDSQNSSPKESERNHDIELQIKKLSLKSANATVTGRTQQEGTTKPEDNPSLSNHPVGVVFETAWQLAQITTVGRVQLPSLSERYLNFVRILSSERLEELLSSQDMDWIVPLMTWVDSLTLQWTPGVNIFR